MKKQKRHTHFFLSLLFIGVALMGIPVTVSAADTILVIGDSIAVGVSGSLRGVTKTSAVVGASSGTIAGYDGSGTFTHMVISAGSNDPTSSSLAANLRRIRAKQPNAKVVWILPYNAAAKATVRSVAGSDATVDLSSFPAATDGVHPRSYSQVAAAVQTALGAAAGAATTGGATTTGTGGPTYNAVAASPIEAGLVTCGLSGDDPRTVNFDESKPCTACHALLMVDTIIDWIRNVMTVIAIAVIFGMGILYIVSAGNDKMIGIAKGGIKAALIGVVWILVAWVVVSTVVRIMGASDFFADVGLQQTGAFSFSCDTSSAAGTAASTNFGAGANSGGGTGSGSGGTGTGYSGSGSCQPVTNSTANPCSTSNLASSCFGGASVNAWSAICQAESNGNVRIPSSVDVCADGNAASFGLFQINITANTVDGLNCPAAFSGGAYTSTNHNCRVINPTLYNQCKAAAQTASKNIATACRLSNNGTNTGPWGAARRCNIPRSL
jgi:Type IV secretion system pilin